jgi:hypothetical protein
MRLSTLSLALSAVLLGACVAPTDSPEAENDTDTNTGAAQSAATLPTLSGTYTTPNRSGTLTYTATRYFYRIGSGGWVRVDGTRYWGVFVKGYALTFYYGVDSTGPVAGTVILSAQLPDGTYPGTVTFNDKAGNVTDTGTVSVTLN